MFKLLKTNSISEVAISHLRMYLPQYSAFLKNISRFDQTMQALLHPNPKNVYKEGQCKYVQSHVNTHRVYTCISALHCKCRNVQVQMCLKAYCDIPFLDVFDSCIFDFQIGKFPILTQHIALHFYFGLKN